MNEQFFTSTLPLKTAQLVKMLQGKKLRFLDQFYLSGGTALSLQIGHRESEDLDFFARKNFDPKQLQNRLSDLGQMQQTELAEGTLNTYINGVKLQFLYYPYKLLQSTLVWDGINISSVADIACTKLQTIGMRGSKKDFIDLFFLFQTFTLKELLKLTQEKYAPIKYSQLHILKSLIYFSDAELQPMPRMHKDIAWQDVKIQMITAVKSIEME